MISTACSAVTIDHHDIRIISDHWNSRSGRLTTICLHIATGYLDMLLLRLPLNFFGHLSRDLLQRLRLHLPGSTYTCRIAGSFNSLWTTIKPRPSLFDKKPPISLLNIS